MVQPNIIYIPGYREENKPRFPGYELENHCKEVGRKFARIVLPGEHGDTRNGAFCGSTMRSKVGRYLQSIDKSPIILNAYSLSCREVVNALLVMSEKKLTNIQSVNFIHPNTHPLYSIQVMDWATNRNLATLLDQDQYLNSRADEVFESLMKPVGDSKEGRGDPQQFQRDLKRYKNEDLAGKNFLSKVEELKDKGLNCNIEIGENDQMVDPKFSSTIQDRTKRLALRKITAIKSHRPSKATIENLFSHIEKAA